jgi:hypothetical protein
MNWCGWFICPSLARQREKSLQHALLVVLCPKTDSTNTQQGVKKSKGNLLKNNACQQILNVSSLDLEKRLAIMVIQIGT